ncbi:MAG: VCBS repeat-containing protein [Spirochaetota bacterium]
MDGTSVLYTLSASVDIGEFYDDGDLDVFYGVQHVPIEIHLNNGDGSFFEHAVSVDNPASNRARVSEVQLADLNGDGDIDAFVYKIFLLAKCILFE